MWRHLPSPAAQAVSSSRLFSFGSPRGDSRLACSMATQSDPSRDCSVHRLRLPTEHLERLRRNRRAKREDAKVAKISPRKPLRTLAFFASSRFGWLKRMHSESSSRELLITEENLAQKTRF